MAVLEGSGAIVVQNGFDHGEGFFQYLCDAFDVLYAEGAECPTMMSVGLHCWLAGRPGRTAALARFVDYAGEHERVWITTRGWRRDRVPGYQYREPSSATAPARGAMVPR